MLVLIIFTVVLTMLITVFVTLLFVSKSISRSNNNNNTEDLKMEVMENESIVVDEETISQILDTYVDDMLSKNEEIKDRSPTPPLS